MSRLPDRNPETSLLLFRAWSFVKRIRKSWICASHGPVVTTPLAVGSGLPSVILLAIVTQRNLRPNQPRGTSAIRRFTLLLCALVALSFFILATAFLIETAHMHRLGSYPPPGVTYKIGDYDTHLVCTGTGSPTIVLEAGLGDDFLSSRRVQPALSGITRVCSYDRAGYGWSAARPGPRDTDHVALELHALLTLAHIDSPLVLMGHSAGGLFIRRYASKYPHGIVGLVFVDSSTPTQFKRLPAEFRVMEDFTWDKLFLPFGITRLRGHCGVTDPSTPDVNLQLEWHDCTRGAFATTEREEKDFPQSCDEAKDTGPFSDIPILIFSQDPALHFGGSPYPLVTMQQAAATWNTLQEELKRLSPRSRRIIARGSTHYVQVLRPELVIREVKHLIGEIHGSEPPRQDYGSTTTQ
jgi:pimeloyl-ACP methyl ester carboxylesterase